MGAWGYGSFDNDSAMDFISELINEKSIKKIINKKRIESYEYDKIRVAAEILIHLHKLSDIIWVYQSTIDGIVEGLKVAISDDEWFESWDDELRAKLLKKQLKKFIRELEKIEGY